MIVVKGTEALIACAGLAQIDVTADNFDNIAGILYLLNQGSPVVRQRAPGLQER